MLAKMALTYGKPSIKPVSFDYYYSLYILVVTNTKVLLNKPALLKTCQANVY